MGVLFKKTTRPRIRHDIYHLVDSIINYGKLRTFRHKDSSILGWIGC